MATLKKLHFYIGLLVIIHFVITGLLMRLNFFAIEPEDTLVRMMLRANHIYILYSGLVHLLLSYSLKESRAGNLHYIASGILILATIGISLSFYIDPKNHLDLKLAVLHRELTGYSVQGCLLGIGLHLSFLQFGARKKKDI